jgi:hypothetical protein
MSAIFRLVMLVFNDSKDGTFRTHAYSSVVVAVSNAILWLASWTIVLAATMHANHHGPLALSLVSFVGITCIVVERRFPSVATRTTLAACVLTLYQRSRAALVSPYAEVAILSVYGLMLFTEWLIVARIVYTSSSPAEGKEDCERGNVGFGLNQSGGMGNSADLPDLRNDPELAVLYQMMSESIYLVVAALPSTDYSLASVGHSPLRLSVGLLMLVFGACSTLPFALAGIGAHLPMPDHALRNAMMVTHAPYSWTIPLARAVGDVMIAVIASRRARIRGAM